MPRVVPWSQAGLMTAGPSWASSRSWSCPARRWGCTPGGRPGVSSWTRPGAGAGLAAQAASPVTSRIETMSEVTARIRTESSIGVRGPSFTAFPGPRGPVPRPSGAHPERRCRRREPAGSVPGRCLECGPEPGVPEPDPGGDLAAAAVTTAPAELATQQSAGPSPQVGLPMTGWPRLPPGPGVARWGGRGGGLGAGALCHLSRRRRLIAAGLRAYLRVQGMPCPTSRPLLGAARP